MRWRYETYTERKLRRESWRWWFAWYPVSDNGETRWLEWVRFREELWLRATWYSPDVWITHYDFESTKA